MDTLLKDDGCKKRITLGKKQQGQRLIKICNLNNMCTMIYNQHRSCEALCLCRSKQKKWYILAVVNCKMRQQGNALLKFTIENIFLNINGVLQILFKIVALFLLFLQNCNFKDFFVIIESMLLVCLFTYQYGYLRNNT